MESTIHRALALEHQPVAVLLADEAPAGAARFAAGKWGCVMTMFASAARGRAAAFDRETYGCWGGGVGLGFGNAYRDFPGGVPCFTRFLSTGNESWELGRTVAARLRGAGAQGRGFADRFAEGERYVRTPELALDFVDRLPIRQVPTRYVVLKPLASVNPARETPSTIVFPVDADRLSALVVLANFGRTGTENVIVPFAASCQNIGIIPLREADSATPRAVVGHTDISARGYVRRTLGRDVVTFAVPWKLFRELEAEVEESFLVRDTWRSLLAPDRARADPAPRRVGEPDTPCPTCSRAGCEVTCPGLAAQAEDGGISAATLAAWKEEQCTAVPGFTWASRALHLVDEVERLRRELRASRERDKDEA